MTFDRVNEHGDRECSGCEEPEWAGHLDTCPRAGRAFYERELLGAFDTAYRLSGSVEEAMKVLQGNPYLGALGWNVVDTPRRQGVVETYDDPQRVTFKRLGVSDRAGPMYAPQAKAHPGDAYVSLSWPVEVRRAAGRKGRP